MSFKTRNDKGCGYIVMFIVVVWILGIFAAFELLASCAAILGRQ